MRGDTNYRLCAQLTYVCSYLGEQIALRRSAAFQSTPILSKTKRDYPLSLNNLSIIVIFMLVFGFPILRYDFISLEIWF